MGVAQFEHTQNKEIHLALKRFGANKKVVKVGWFAKSKYPDGVQVAEAAAKNELGDPKNNIPPRPFMRTAMTGNKGIIKSDALKIGTQIIHGKMKPEDGLNLFGSKIEGLVRKQISKIWSPKLSAMTLAKRKERGNSSKKPLVDTRVMINSLTHVVDKKEGGSRPKGSRL